MYVRVIQTTCGMSKLWHEIFFWQFCMHFPGQTCSRPLDQRALLASQSYDVSLSIEIMGSKVNTPALLQQRSPWRSEQLSCFWPLPCCWYLWAALYLLSPCIGPLKGHWGLQSAFEWRLLTRLFACFSPGTCHTSVCMQTKSKPCANLSLWFTMVCMVWVLQTWYKLYLNRINPDFMISKPSKPGFQVYMVCSHNQTKLKPWYKPCANLSI